MDEPAAEDLAASGVPSDTATSYANVAWGNDATYTSTLKQRIRWKARALKAERDLHEMHGTLNMYRLGFACMAVAMIAAVIAVVVK